MRVLGDAIAPWDQATERQPLFVYEQTWNTGEVANTYFTSSSAAAHPVAADVIDSTFISVSGQTQKINPDIATSTIGTMTVELLDLDGDVTSKINTHLASLEGLRGKVGRLYVGYGNLAFDEYDLRLTYIVDHVRYRDGKYTITLSDIQRATRQKIFSPVETNLNASITETAKFIPVTTSDTSLFPTFEHGSEYTTRPGQTVGYAKIGREVFSYSGMSVDGVLGPGFNVVKRGDLNTRAVAHTVESGSEESRRPKITEHIYIEGAAPKVIYALLTGEVEGQTGDMPEHWHLGISTSYVKLTDFQSLGNDYWNTADDTGRFVRIENPGAQDGKRFIEKEILLWLGAFMPVYADGRLGIRRLKSVLSDASYLSHLTTANIKSYGDLNHSMSRVMNDIEIDWNWVDARGDFTKTSKLIDGDSITLHKRADMKRFAFKTVHTGLHTDNDLRDYFDTLRDRYSGPPLEMTLEAMPSLSLLEVGDTVRVELDQVRDYNSGSGLDRVFEIQQIATNWMTGDLRFSLFASSQAAGAIERSSLSAVLDDAFYTQAGTDLASILTISAGTVTASHTLTGHASDIDNSAAIYYYDGDLTIGAGVTITITENVQLRIKGALQINGKIDGAANGAAGGAATTQYNNGSTSFTGSPFEYPGFDYNSGTQAYFGIPGAPGALGLYNGYNPTLSASTAYVSAQNTAFPVPPAHIGVESVPYYNLKNDTTADTLTGYPSDLRGNGGVSGNAFHWSYGVTAYVESVWNILANGGAGGDGGAGLLIIARGMAFGGTGEIDLSGGDSSYGTSYTLGGKTFYGSAGAPGAPGALLLLIDGNATNPDIDDTVFTANYGDAPVPASTTEVSGVGVMGLPLEERLVSSWAYSSVIYNGAPVPATENVSASGSAHRVIYIPEDETVAEETGEIPPDVTGFSALQNGSLVVFRWDFLADIADIAGFEIRYGPRGNTSFEDAAPLTQVTRGTSITSADVPPGDWTFYCTAVNNSLPRNYSGTPASVDLVVVSTLDIIEQNAQAPDWTGTKSNFVVHHTGKLVPQSQNLASADGWDTFDVFVINPYDTCTYESAEIDISFDDLVRVWGDIQSALGPGETGIAAPTLSVDYKTAAGSYDGFESWSVGEVTARYFKHKLTLDTTKGVAYISEFLPTVDVLEHTIRDQDVSVAASGGSTITFATAFHSAPFVRVFVKGTSALHAVIDNITATGFDVQVFNDSGSDVGGTIDWEATGS